MTDIWGVIWNIVFAGGLLVTLVTIYPVAKEMHHHPKGLKVLFFAEMWERFSYYGMRGLLTVYLVQHFLFDQADAQKTFSSYTTLVYLAPLLGGVLADRFLGTRKAIAFGAIALVAGHFAMGLEGKPTTQTLSYQGATYQFVAEGRNELYVAKLKIGDAAYAYSASEKGIEIKNIPANAPLPAFLPKGSYKLEKVKAEGPFQAIFYVALSLIILGVGFLKPNISSIVGQLYPQGDPRRDPGFTLYYYGINLGAFWAAILCGALGTVVGWWAGFGLAGVGMLVGYIAFVRGKDSLEGKGEPPNPEALKQKILGPINLEMAIYVAALISIPLIWVLVQNNAMVGKMLAIGSVAILVYIIYHMVTQCSKEEAGRLVLALILILASVVFFTLFEQAGSSLALFTAGNVALPNAGFVTITAPQTQSFNAGFILIFAPAFAWLWVKLGQRNLDPSAPMKFALALMQVGLGFLILVWGSQFANEQARVPVIFLALAYLFHTTGELCLSPVGLSWMTKLSTPKLISTLMATWFLGSSGAQFLGGIIAQYTATETVAGQVTDPAKALMTAIDVFSTIGWWSIGIGVTMALASPLLKRLASGIK
ncbi:peptide MFS transporter [Candidatus Phycosocius spiralis]|uniref:Peptide ABC transporter n=1 Tax=Candidatus Phycosocius spiralis TaxID=2815099 RepID=A0ABQ4PVP0_9PROT|nr:oligopeptide:H+ symporter [Candidatus Phycosocius spiralis]GIU67045.1 peptide ABC transporter [Candidatus Phycosocius spiralis]